jgi:hypothetical protein
MRIMAVTPNKITGWAVWENRIIEHGYLGPKEHHGELWNLLIGEWQKADTVIYEPWSLQELMPVTIEYVGVIKAAAEAFSMRLVAQNARAREWATSTKLRRWGAKHTDWFNDRFQIDAERHILFHLCHNVFVPDEVRNKAIHSLRPPKAGKVETP